MTIKKLENGDLIHSLLKAFFHGGQDRIHPLFFHLGSIQSLPN